MWKRLGHISYNCDLREDQNDETADAHANNQHSEEIHQEPQAAESVDAGNDATCPDISENNPESNEGMECEDRAQSFKRQLNTDSDWCHSPSTRRTQLRSAPSLSSWKKVDKNIKATKVSDKPPSK